MMRHAISGLLVVFCLCLILSEPQARGQDNGGPREAEYKAVPFGTDEKKCTKRLNDLAKDGWQYVGPLGNGMVAFKRAARSAQEVELEKFQGTWARVSSEGEGVIRADDQNHTFVVSGNKWAWKLDDVVQQAGTFKLVNVTKNPKQWDFTVTEGANVGGVGYAIYHFDGDTFKYCAAGSPETRPTEFRTKEAAGGLYCCVWKRAKQ